MREAGDEVSVAVAQSRVEAEEVLVLAGVLVLNLDQELVPALLQLNGILRTVLVDPVHDAALLTDLSIVGEQPVHTRAADLPPNVLRGRAVDVACGHNPLAGCGLALLDVEVAHQVVVVVVVPVEDAIVEVLPGRRLVASRVSK
ncbi:hypothetical protein ACFU8W_32510 [Streptomyces sp. NPDC057565]|uniref:hypothetical protein n=1 Tax=Streptomyces sp. NPDC057565 TaxID=3346169 RepID=UPI0036C428E5